MGRVTGKYMRVGDEDGEDRTRPHPVPLPCLISSSDPNLIISTPLHLPT